MLTLFIPSMNAQTLPGQGLSLSQLVLVLNEGLKRTAFTPSYVAKDHPGHVSEALENDDTLT